MIFFVKSFALAAFKLNEWHYPAAVGYSNTGPYPDEKCTRFGPNNRSHNIHIQNTETQICHHRDQNIEPM